MKKFSFLPILFLLWMPFTGCGGAEQDVQDVQDLQDVQDVQDLQDVQDVQGGQDVQGQGAQGDEPASAVAGSSATGYSAAGSSSARTVSVETVIVDLTDFVDEIRVTGSVEAMDDAVVSSEASGRVLSIRELGDVVEEGDALVELDDRLAMAQFEAAEAGYKLAKSTLDRLESLYADSIVSTQDLQMAQAQFEQAMAQRNLAEKQLGDTAVKAPFRGRIEERMIRKGELINPGMPVVRLVNADGLRIKAGVSEIYAADIVAGTPVSVDLPLSGLQELEAVVSFTGQVIDPDTRTFTVEVQLTNQSGRIKPDMIAGLSIERMTLPDAVVIPRTAILRNEQGTSVFVAKAEQGVKTAALVAVETGLTSGSLVQITQGLSEGDEVIVTGTRILSLGDKLNIIRSDSSSRRAEELR